MDDAATVDCFREGHLRASEIGSTEWFLSCFVWFEFMMVEGEVVELYCDGWVSGVDKEGWGMRQGQAFVFLSCFDWVFSLVVRDFITKKSDNEISRKENPFD